MEQSFKDITRKVVNSFLQNILFIDDNAYQSEIRANAFDAKAISSVFAQNEKLCTVLAPSSTEDLKSCSSLFAKSDVIVLDWYLNLKNNNQIENEEADADVEEPRGVYTIDLIKTIVENASDKKLKMIIIYTGDYTNLADITKQIYDKFSDNNQFSISKSDYRVYSSNILIIIRAKSNGEDAKYNQNLRSKIIDYKNLPNEITKEFSNFVGGLLPNFALSAITAIRDNTSNILGVFSKDIDPAFLGHYVSIPDSNNAVSMLSEIFGSAITDLIDSNNFDIQTWINAWLTQNINKPFKTKIGKNELMLSKEVLKNIVESSDKEFKTKLQACFATIKGDDDHLKKDAIKLFKTKLKKPNYKLAKLVQHSNLFSTPEKEPQLTTGTIVKYKKTPKRWNFLLCIQQSCDSVRISPKEKRTFLFLPLTQDTKGEAVITEENKHLIVDNRSYSLESHKFSPTNNKETLIIAKKIKNEYVFQDSDKKQFIWVAELKKLFAQHIVSAYASQLSRVGIDNSEWIRLIGKTGK